MGQGRAFNKNGEKLDEYGESPLHHAARNASPQNISHLCELAGSTANVDTISSNGSTPLHLAAGSSGGASAAAVRVLVSHGADVNNRTRNGWSALMFAAYRKRQGALRELLLLGGDPAVKNNEGKNAQEMALNKGYAHISDCLDAESLPTADEIKAYRSHLTCPGNHDVHTKESDMNMHKSGCGCWG